MKSVIAIALIIITSFLVFRANADLKKSSLNAHSSNKSCDVAGILRQWHRVEIRCGGYFASEKSDATFTDHRMMVTFSQGEKSITVPGHFAADGAAAHTGAQEGNIWRAYFMPPSPGQWHYSVSLRRGENISVSDAPDAGKAVAPIHNTQGAFAVIKSKAGKRDMRSRGLLLHQAGERYLRHQGDNSIFISAGMDSPENIFGYKDFDNTRKFNSAKSCKGILHTFAPHLDDYKSKDPTWRDGKGKSLIGLINYIASHGINTVYVMTMSVHGDGCDVHPWAEYDGNRRAFDVSKLDQWELAFSHMTQKGMMIHMITQETENDQLLNDGDLGLERKLYYRELISRFGHHPALQWNLGEENTNSAEQVKSFAKYIKATDPYTHPIAMHTYPTEKDYLRYEPLLGDKNFDAATFQLKTNPKHIFNDRGVYALVQKWARRSAEAGHPWVNTMTEDSSKFGAHNDKEISYEQRAGWMWANVMAGGGGFEWYLKQSGKGHAYDLAVENLREFDSFWEQSGYVRFFFIDYLQNKLGLDLQTLTPNNGLTSTDADWVLADEGKAYVIYLFEGDNTTLTLPDNSLYQTRWFNPASGKVYRGKKLRGPGQIALGKPPNKGGRDWAVVVRKRK